MARTKKKQSSPVYMYSRGVTIDLWKFVISYEVNDVNTYVIRQLLECALKSEINIWEEV